MTSIETRHPNRIGFGFAYLLAVFAALMVVEIVSFARIRADLFQHIAVWLFATAFVTTLLKEPLGLIITVLLVAVGPALHLQLNSLFSIELKSWAYPGSDACVGFLSGWALKGNLKSLSLPLKRMPARALLGLHGWVVVSSVIAVIRNVWQSGSELSLKGVRFNVALVRGISWHDDFYPLQDLFFVSLALVVVLAAWSILLHDKRVSVRSLSYAVLFAAAGNALFGIGQRLFGVGWFHDTGSLSINAFFPDMHSFAALMVIALSLGFGLLKNSRSHVFGRVTVFTVMAICAAALFRSNSRFLLFASGLIFGSLAVAQTFVGRGWRRIAALLCLVALAAAFDLVLRSGYRGLSYETIAALARNPTAIDATLALRPEIWRAAIKMFAHFPFFGLGQGEFYRLSSIHLFSQSDFLSSSGGENAHNYFLQSFVELGPVGLALFLLCLLPMVRLGRANFRSVSFYGLLGVVMGNVFAHALLVREMLMLAAVLAAMYLWEAEQLQPNVVRPMPYVWSRRLLIALCAAVSLAMVDAASSFQRFPFTFAQRCQEQKSLSEDGWAGGTYRIRVPTAAQRVEADFSWERPDVAWRPVSLLASVRKHEAVIAQAKFFPQRPDDPPATVSFDLSAGQSDRVLEIQASNCYLGLNYGIGYAPRRLGFRVRAVRFLNTAGAEITGP